MPRSIIEQDLDRLLDDDEESIWSSNPQLCTYEDEGDCHPSNSNRLSIIRSPRTEEILKNVEQALRKTDQVGHHSILSLDYLLVYVICT